MKRLFRRLMRWIYADGVEAITDHLVEEELRRRFPEGFRISPREDQLIPQDVYVAVLQHLPNPAEIIHDEWLSHTNVRNVRTFTVQMASRDVQLEMTAERIKLAPELRSPVICNGRYAHFLDVEIRGWGKPSAAKPDYAMRFALMQYPLRGEGVGGQVPYWQYQAENPKILHRFTVDVLDGIARGFSSIL